MDDARPAPGSSDLAEIAAAKVIGRISEGRRIGDVVSLGPEFERKAFLAEQMPTGTIIVRDDSAARVQELTVIYARVSAAENKSNLDSQAERARQYCIARGYQIGGVIKEIGSGVNDQRPRLIKLLNDPTARRIVVEHKDRLTRFGFNYIETLLKQQGRSIEVINTAADGKEDLLQDFIAIITSFCARLYG